MSGGAFEYSQYKIEEIKNIIQDRLDKMGSKKSKEELWMSTEYYEKYPEEKFFPMESDMVIKVLKDGIESLRIAKIYADSIDRYLSGDDSEDSLVLKCSDV